MVFSIQNNKKFLILLFLISLLINSLFFIFFLNKDKNYYVCQDSYQYDSVALKIAQENRIYDADDKPSFYRVPGYSMFLSMFYKIFKNDIKLAIYFQILLSSFIPILIFFLSLILFPNNIFLAQLASIFFAFNLGFVLHSGLLMSDILFLFFFLLFSILFFSSFNLFFCDKTFCNKNIKLCFLKIFMSGIFLSLASLIRPVGHFIIIVAIFLVIFSSFKFFQKIKAILSLVSGWLPLVFAWLLRNYLLTGFIFFHTMPGYHFLTYFAAEVDSIANKTTHGESKTKLLKEWENLILEKEESNKKLSEIEKCDLAQEIANKHLKNNIVITTKHAITNILKTLVSLNSSYLLFIDTRTLPTYTGTTTFWSKIKYYLFPQTNNKFLKFLIYFEIIFLVFILLGFLLEILNSLFCLNILCILLKVLPFVFLLLFLTLGSGVARLRLPLEPFFIILGGDFWIKFFRKICKGLSF
ncbi:hypothetical protein K9L05_00635 [Candidatus Babeliales bacterium]|nr:hypothetical protein [Candidatus Babeliales bacterium]MCF7899140.1 hypothetical protein [Candidatus Babeliales bacterium]